MKRILHYRQNGGAFKAEKGFKTLSQAIDKLMEGKKIEPHKLIIKDKNELR